MTTCNSKSECEKAWSKDICIATKGGKIFLRVMWAIVILMLSVTVGGNVYNLGFANDVKHNHESIQEMKEDHGELVKEFKVMKDTQNKMQIEQAVQGQIIRGLAEKFRVPVPETSE